MQLIHDTMHYMVFWGISISCKRYLTAGSRRGEIYTLRGPSLQEGMYMAHRTVYTVLQGERGGCQMIASAPPPPPPPTHHQRRRGEGGTERVATYSP